MAKTLVLITLLHILLTSEVQSTASVRESFCSFLLILNKLFSDKNVLWTLLMLITKFPFEFLPFKCLTHPKMKKTMTVGGILLYWPIQTFFSIGGQ